MTIGDPYLVEIVTATGAFTTITLDMQHGMMDVGQVMECIRAIQSCHGWVMVRLPGWDPALIGKLLDAACDGLILPQVDSADQTLKFVQACHYPPLGNRSYGPTRLGLVPGLERHCIAFAMIESSAGLAAVEEIAAVDHLDGLFVGPGDLGIALGIGPGQDRQEPAFLQALATIQQAAQRHDKYLGIHAHSPGFAALQSQSGFHLVTKWVDAIAIRDSVRDATDQWQAALQSEPGPSLD